MLKPLLLLPAVILFAIGPVSTRMSMAQDASSSKAGAKAANESMARAKEIYKIDCALCHNGNGDGKTDLAKDMQLTMTDFTDPKTLEARSDDDLFNLIRKGKDKMPGEDAGRAKNDEVKALILYIRNLPKTQPAVPAAATATAAPTAN
jgi:mono/diheme cytochrome c family protein